MGYPSDVTDDDWLLIEKYFERTNKRGAVSTHTKRDIVNAILYVARGGVIQHPNGTTLSSPKGTTPLALNGTT